MQGQPLDAPSLRPFWKAAADLGLYVFIHPPPRLIGWAYVDADDLWRMLGWEFSLMVAIVRLIDSGLFDELPALKIQVSHFGGGIARYLHRIRGLQNRSSAGTARIPRHSQINASHLIIIYSIGCFTIVLDGQVPTMQPSEALNGCASAWQSSHLRGSSSPLAIVRPFMTTMRWLHTVKALHCGPSTAGCSQWRRRGEPHPEPKRATEPHAN